MLTLNVYKCEKLIYVFRHKMVWINISIAVSFYQAGREDDQQRSDALKRLSELNQKHLQLQTEIKKYSHADPDVLNKMQSDTEVTFFKLTWYCLHLLIIILPKCTIYFSAYTLTFIINAFSHQQQYSYKLLFKQIFVSLRWNLGLWSLWQ